MKLCELNDSPCQWKWKVDPDFLMEPPRHGKSEIATFDVGSYAYEVSLTRHRDSPDEETWNVFFYQSTGKGTTKMTGTGNQFRVMSTVNSVIADAIGRIRSQKGKGPKKIAFSSEARRGRVEAYKKIAGKLDGYILKVNDEGHTVEYTLVRDDDS